MAAHTLTNGPVRNELGHLEMDFIVSKLSPLGVAGDRGQIYQAHLGEEAAKQKARHYSCRAFFDVEGYCCSKYHHR